MNKARITYRFEHNRSYDGKRRAEQSEPVVIPLHPEDFTIQDERDMDQNPDVRQDGDAVDDERSFRNAYREQFDDAPPNRRDDVIDLTGLSESRRYSDLQDTAKDTYYINPIQTDYSTWKHPVVEEAEELEKLIRSSGPYLEEEAPRDGSRPERSYRRTAREHKPGYSWIKVSSSIAGALGTGLLFGFLALSFFHGNQTMSGNADKMLKAVLNPDIAAGSKSTADKGQTAGLTAPEAPSAGSGSVALPAQTYYVVQNGVFSTMKSAQEEESALKQQGFAGTVVPGKSYRVLAGIASDRNDALMLSQQLRDNGMDVYIKTLQLQAGMPAVWTGVDSSAMSAFYSQGRALAEKLDQLAVKQLAGRQPEGLGQAEFGQLQQAHQAWLGSLNLVHRAAPKQAGAVLDAMAHDLNSAVMVFNEYEKNPQFSELWQVQAAVTDFLLNEQKLAKAGTTLQ